MMKPRFVLFAVLCSFLLASSASAFEIKKTDDGLPIQWDQEVVEYVVNASGSDDMDPQSAVDAVQASFTEWSDLPGSDLKLSFVGTTASKDYGYFRDQENSNLVVWEEQAWPFDNSALAVTLTTFSTRTGKLLDADIVVNGVSYTWRANGSTKYHDISNSLTHEVGHFVGLDHSDDGEATMYPSAPAGEMQKRDLAQDDLNGLYFLYGNGEAPLLGDALPENFTPSIQSEDSGVRINDAQVHLSCTTALSPSGGQGLGGLLLLGLALGAVSLSRRERRKRLSVLLAALCLSAAGLAMVPTFAGATELPALSLESLAQSSDRVVVAQVTARQARFEGGLIWTRTTVQVQDCLGQLRDRCVQGEEMTVLTPGGQVGEVGQSVSGLRELEVGQRVVLFLALAPRDAELAPDRKSVV